MVSEKSWVNKKVRYEKVLYLGYTRAFADSTNYAKLG